MVIRTANPRDAVSIAKVHVDSWKTTYKGIVPDGYLERLSYERKEAVWRHAITNQADTPVFVAEDEENGIVGFANGGKERSGNTMYQGELYALYILQGFQESGIGRALITAIIDRLKEHGYENMMTWVLKDNPALNFYEHLGGKKFDEKPEYIGGTRVIEYAMGWHDSSEWD